MTSFLVYKLLENSCVFKFSRVNKMLLPLALVIVKVEHSFRALWKLSLQTHEVWPLNWFQITKFLTSTLVLTSEWDYYAFKNDWLIQNKWTLLQMACAFDYAKDSTGWCSSMYCWEFLAWTRLHPPFTSVTTLVNTFYTNGWTEWRLFLCVITLQFS